MNCVHAGVLREATSVAGGEKGGAVDAHGGEPQVSRATAPRIALVHQSERPANAMQIWLFFFF